MKQENEKNTAEELASRDLMEAVHSLEELADSAELQEAVKALKNALSAPALRCDLHAGTPATPVFTGDC